MTQKYAGDATFNDGRIDAMEEALATFLGLMKPEVRAAFSALYAKNIEVFDEITIALPISEAWREGLSTGAASIQKRLASREGKTKDQDPDSKGHSQKPAS